VIVPSSLPRACLHVTGMQGRRDEMKDDRTGRPQRTPDPVGRLTDSDTSAATSGPATYADLQDAAIAADSRSANARPARRLTIEATVQL
jgi:hypothetical protein